MSDAIAIRVEGLTKIYPGRLGAWAALRAIARGRLETRSDAPAALGGIDLELERGASLGIVGRNGSGKTTLLRILSGGLRPSTGQVSIEGRSAALIDLGAGIDPDFSGRENALLLGMLAGATRAEVRAALDEIRDFSGLEEAFEAPVRTYSTGMTLRLAFASAIVTEPEVLLIDEVLAVGDAFFQQRCLLRIRQLRERGCTVVLVSHDPSAIVGFCDRAIRLERGVVALSGDPGEVMADYLSALHAEESRDATSADEAARSASADAPSGASGTGATPEPAAALEPASGVPNVDARHGDGRAQVIGVELRDDGDAPLASPVPGAPLRVVITVEALEPLTSPVIGFTLRDRLGEILSATNTEHERQTLPALEAGQRISVEFRLRWPRLSPGAFSLSPAVADGSLSNHSMADWIDNAVAFEVLNPRAIYGWIELEGVRIRSAVHEADSTDRADSTDSADSTDRA